MVSHETNRRGLCIFFLSDSGTLDSGTKFGTLQLGTSQAILGLERTRTPAMFHPSFPGQSDSPAAATAGSVGQYLPTGPTFNADRSIGGSENDRSASGRVSDIVSTPLPTTIPVPPSALVRSLERLGWELLTCEVDVTRETARIELQSFGGRLVTFDARNGRATITREQIETETILIGRRGDRCRVDRLRTRFLGRQACGFGTRSGLRMFANYLTDNSPLRQLPASEVRDSFRLLLGGAR